MRQLSIYLLFTCALVGNSLAQEHKISVQRFEPPLYPPIARQAHIVGAVVLDLQLSSTGEVVEAKVVSGHKMLVGRALDNVKKWRFHCDDCAYGEKFKHQITYDFQLAGGGDLTWSVAYNFPERVTIYASIPEVQTQGLFAPDLPWYFFLWKLVHPRYWAFHGFD